MPSLLTWDMETRYESAGEGQPLVLIHGFTLDHRVWTPQARVFARVGRAVRYDLRGHGESSAPKTGYTIDGLTMQLRTFLDGLRISRPVLVGHSYGAALAIHFALLHRTRVAALILANPEIWGAPIPEDSFYKGKTAAAFDPGPLDDPKVGKKALQAWLQSEIFATTRKSEAAFRAIETIVLAHGCAPWAQMQERAPVYPDDFSHLSALDLPVLVLSGANDDSYFRGAARAIGEHVRAARVVEIPDCGHVVSAEKPIEFNRQALEFLHASGLIGPLSPGIEVPPRPHHKKRPHKERERERRRAEEPEFVQEPMEDEIEFLEEPPEYAEERPVYLEESSQPPEERQQVPEERQPRREERPRRPEGRRERGPERGERSDDRRRRPQGGPQRGEDRQRRHGERPQRAGEGQQRPGDRPQRHGERPDRPGERPQRPGDRSQRPGDRQQRPQGRPPRPQDERHAPSGPPSDRKRRRRRRRRSDEPGEWKPRTPTSAPPKEEKKGFWSKLFGRKKKGE
jgi:pimeloyl-ACP methyl ester carboxylesterase